MLNDSFLRVYRILRFVKKLDFPFWSLGGPRHGARVWCLGRVPKHRNLWQEVEGLLFSPKKLSVGAYFELLFLGCGFLIHLSNRSPWQELVTRSRGLVIQPPKLSVDSYFELSSRLWFPYSSFQQVQQPSIPSPVEEDTSKIRDTTGTVLFKGYSLYCHYAEALCSMVPS